VSSHSFRPSALNAAQQAGLNPRQVNVISGHRSIAALERYIDWHAPMFLTIRKTLEMDVIDSAKPPERHHYTKNDSVNHRIC